MDPFKEGHKIFNKVANSVNWRETRSLKEAVKFLECLIKETQGQMILDFLDSGSWDSINGLDADYKNGYLKIHWRDTRVKTESKSEKEIMMVAMRNDSTFLYSLLIKFKELRILKSDDPDKSTLLLIKGLALKDKEINTYLKNGSSEYKLSNEKNNFSKTVLRKVGRCKEKIKCFNTPIFSMIFLPKNTASSSIFSKECLLEYNLNEALIRLNKVKKDLTKEDLKDDDIICEKANTVRRVLEYVLKVELCYYQFKVNVKKEYSNLVLGDLQKLTKPYRDDDINEFIKMIIVHSNEFSHESGKSIDKKIAIMIAELTTLYIEWFKNKIEFDNILNRIGDKKI